MFIKLSSIKQRRAIFNIIVTVVFILSTKMPLQKIFQLFFTEEISSLLKVSLIGSIIIVVSIRLAKQSLFFSEVSLHFRAKNILLFILPFLYPGILSLANYRPGCIQYDIALLISFFTIMIKAICEELVFRGIILSNDIDTASFNVSSGLILKSSIYFALAHSANLFLNDFSLMEWIAQIIYAFYMGILFAALLINTKNIWVLGFVHGLLNFLFSLCISQTSEVLTQNTPIFKDYFAQVFKFVILFSPILFFYFLLLRMYKKTS